MNGDDNTAIIRYVDAAEGERYWRINRQGLVLSRRAMDKHVVAMDGNRGDVRVKGVIHEAVACQWPSRNVIYRRWEL